MPTAVQLEANVRRIVRNNWCLYAGLTPLSAMLCELRLRDYVWGASYAGLVYRLRVPEQYRRQGPASAAMDLLCQEADILAVPLCLMAVPDLDTIPPANLLAFYAGFGFVPTQVGCRFLLRLPKE